MNVFVPAKQTHYAYHFRMTAVCADYLLSLHAISNDTFPPPHITLEMITHN